MLGKAQCIHKAIGVVYICTAASEKAKDLELEQEDMFWNVHKNICIQLSDCVPNLQNRNLRVWPSHKCPVQTNRHMHLYHAGIISCIYIMQVYRAKISISCKET